MTNLLAKGSSCRPQPVIIGLYGISGCGKSYLMNSLQQEPSNSHILFVEGSERIASLLPGGLEEFHELDDEQKAEVRVKAINDIKEQSIRENRPAIVTGHFMFWKGDSASKEIWTLEDMKTFTHIIYLNIPVDVMLQRRNADEVRERPRLLGENLRMWRDDELSSLRQLCRQHGILFISLSDPKRLRQDASNVIGSFLQDQSTEANISSVIAQLNQTFGMFSNNAKPETILVFDGDKTISVEDTGNRFWEALPTSTMSGQPQASSRILKELFGGPMGYSDKAFSQAGLLYEENTDEKLFEAHCEKIASWITVRPEVIELIRSTSRLGHVGVVVVTCGVQRIWEHVFRRNDLEKMVKVIGNGRLTHGFVVTPEVKAAVVSHLRQAVGATVWAFGDSPLDLPMLEEADEAIVVVGEKEQRSLTMDPALAETIAKGRVAHIRQALCPRGVPCRLNEDLLPVVQLDDQSFIDTITRKDSISQCSVQHATSLPIAKILMSPMRDASVAGPALRKAHERAGWYLATEYLTSLIGLQEHAISHVLGNSVTGYRLKDEELTTIIPLMRGGLPMALGVNEAFPMASLVPAAAACDIKKTHLQQQRTVILVDSVINTGASIIHFMHRIRDLGHEQIRVVIVAGVVQAGVLKANTKFTKLMKRFDVSLVALRTSETKFTGSKGTDTGNRLFNTTRLE